MSVFNEEDTATLKILGYGALGFGTLTVALIILSPIVTRSIEASALSSTFHCQQADGLDQ